MKLQVDGNEIHVATGGMAHKPAQPWLVFVHGSGHSHLSWMLQSRALAHDGCNVLAPDFPGHGLSGGAPLDTIGAMARFVFAVMDAAGARDAVIIGHSMGGLIALEMSAIAPQRVRALALVGTAAAIPVSDQLKALAQDNEQAAFAAMNAWSFGPDALIGDNSWPGANHVANGIAVMRQNAKGALAAGLKACANYTGGSKAAAGYAGTALCVFGEFDKMTPSRNGMALAAMMQHAQAIVVKGSGHCIASEKPREFNSALRNFLCKLATA